MVRWLFTLKCNVICIDLVYGCDKITKDKKGMLSGAITGGGLFIRNGCIPK